MQNNEISRALSFCVEQVRRNITALNGRCQNHSSVKNFYHACDNNQWTCGFFPGQVWLAYEQAGDEFFKSAGLRYADSFYDRIVRKIEIDHHDMGFLYTPSCVQAYKLTGNEKARDAAIMAARQLVSRFHETGNFIQAWGRLGARDNYRYIIDCLLNLPLLFWASEETGEAEFREKALKHIETCLKYSVRADGSTFHTVFMNPKTGQFDRGETCQGYRDDSSWARGQAWGVYGLALCYRYTKNEEYYAAFKRVLDYYLSRLPRDSVPYWDLIFSDGDNEPRDSSSAAIVSCGLLEIAANTAGADAAKYTDLAKVMIQSLIENYSVKNPAVSNGLILHGTYSKKSPYNTCTEEGVDECLGWGDYFYFEALTRLMDSQKVYW